MQLPTMQVEDTLPPENDLLLVGIYAIHARTHTHTHTHTHARTHTHTHARDELYVPPSQ